LRQGELVAFMQSSAAIESTDAAPFTTDGSAFGAIEAPVTWA
jgi:hypothetical protein